MNDKVKGILKPDTKIIDLPESNVIVGDQRPFGEHVLQQMIRNAKARGLVVLRVDRDV